MSRNIDQPLGGFKYHKKIPLTGVNQPEGPEPKLIEVSHPWEVV